MGMSMGMSMGRRAVVRPTPGFSVPGVDLGGNLAGQKMSGMVGNAGNAGNARQSCSVLGCRGVVLVMRLTALVDPGALLRYLVERATTDRKSVV